MQDLAQLDFKVISSRLQELKLWRECRPAEPKGELPVAGSSMLQTLMSDITGSGLRAITLADEEQDITLPRYVLWMLDLSDCYLVIYNSERGKARSGKVQEGIVVRGPESVTLSQQQWYYCY